MLWLLALLRPTFMQLPDPRHFFSDESLRMNCVSMHPIGQALTQAWHFVHFLRSTVETPRRFKTLLSLENLNLKGTFDDWIASIYDMLELPTHFLAANVLPVPWQLLNHLCLVYLKSLLLLIHGIFKAIIEIEKQLFQWITLKSHYPSLFSSPTSGCCSGCLSAL